MTYRYDVFISYRHQDLDKEWANWLIRAMETYIPPRSLVATLRKAGRPYKISRVFRDEDETAAGGDLSERLKEALRESRNLVVICSRNTPGSVWIDREIDYFESLGRADRVLPILVNGEPSSSFPSAIRGPTDHRSVGSPIDFEPLAADARPRKDLSTREVKHRALLKVIAGALDLKYDDLYQRDWRRRRARLIGVGCAVALALTIALSWLVWTRTDAYQVKSAMAAAPLLLPSASDENVASWCRALVLSGHFDQALTAVESTRESQTGRIDALLATAEAARKVNREGDADALMKKAAELSKNFGPALGIARLKVAKSFIKQGRSKDAKTVIVDAIAATESIADTEENVTSFQQFADLIVEIGDLDYLRQLMQDNSDPVVAAISSIVAAQTTAKSGKLAEARLLTSLAIAASQRREVGGHQSYLLAWIINSAASLGSLTTDNGLLRASLAQARQLPSSQAKSRWLRQIAAAMSQLRRPDDARAILAEIADADERNSASELVVKAFARAGKAEGVAAILNTYEDDEARSYVISGIAEGLAEGRQMAILSRFENLLSAGEKVEILVIATEALRKFGQDVERDGVLDQALQIARSTPDTEGKHEMLFRISTEMIAGGRVEDALAIAREITEPHRRAFALLAVAKNKIFPESFDELRGLLTEAETIEEKVRDPDLRAAGFREMGRVFKRTGDRLEAMKLFHRAVSEATKGGEYGSSTVADVAEEYARLGELRLARTVADQYCGDDDRLRVYTSILLESRGISSEPDND